MYKKTLYTIGNLYEKFMCFLNASKLIIYNENMIMSDIIRYLATSIRIHKPSVPSCPARLIAKYITKHVYAETR